MKKNDRVKVNEAIGLNIKHLREKNKVPRSALANALGLSLGSISNIEHGKQRITADIVPILAVLLSCTIEDIYRNETEIKKMEKIPGLASLKEIATFMISTAKLIEEGRTHSAFHLLVNKAFKLDKNLLKTESQKNPNE